MNIFISAFVLSVAIAPALLWPDLQPDRILVDPDRIEDYTQFAQLNAFVNEAARTGQYFEQSITLDWVDYYVKWSRQVTHGAVRPYHFHRFEMPNGEYRVICRVLTNWIKDLDMEWHQTVHNVTNVFAFFIDANRDGDHNDIVCEFVTAADDRQAGCLLFFYQHNLISFPDVETMAREHHPKSDKLPHLFEDDTEQLQPHHKHVLTSKYCGYFWLTIVGIIACGLLVLVVLGLVGFCVFWLVTKCRTELSSWQFRLRYLRHNDEALLPSARGEIELDDFRGRNNPSLVEDGMEEDEF